jgi:ribokinase
MKVESKPFKIVSIGDLVVDVILSVPQLPVKAAEHQILNGLQLEPGGAGNFLVAGSRLGMEMTALGAIGKDMFSHALLDMLAGENVQVDGLLEQAQGSTTTVFVLEDASRQHVFIGDFGEGDTVHLSENWKRKIESAEAVQLWGYSLNEGRLIDCVLDAAAYAKRQGKLIVFDSGPLLASTKAEHCQKIVEYVSVILCTEDELPVLGEKCGVEAKPEAFLDLGVAIVCVKHGRDGCKIFTGDGIVEHPGYSVPVLDTNAAGDSFMAAFVYGLLAGWPLEKVAAFANAMGAAKVQKFGSGRQVPTADELRKVLRDFDIDVDY